MTTSRCPCLCFAILLMSCGMARAQEPGADAEQAPTFKGRTFEQWKPLVSNDLDADTRADAYRAMHAFLTHSPDDYLKPATEVIKTSLPKERSAVVSEVAYRLLPKKMDASERNALRIAGLRSDHRASVLKSLGYYGSTLPGMPAEEATEELADAVMEVLKEKEYQDVHYVACSALASIIYTSEYQLDRIGPQNVKFKRIHPEGQPGPILKKVLPVMELVFHDSSRVDPSRNDGSQSDVRTQALHLIASFPPEFAVPQLAELFRNLVAAETIVTDPLRRRISRMNGDERMAKQILQRLSYYGSDAKKAVPVLRKIEEDYPELLPILGTEIRNTIKAIEKPAE